MGCTCARQRASQVCLGHKSSSSSSGAAKGSGKPWRCVAGAHGSLWAPLSLSPTQPPGCLLGLKSWLQRSCRLSGAGHRGALPAAERSLAGSTWWQPGWCLRRTQTPGEAMHRAYNPRGQPLCWAPGPQGSPALEGRLNTAGALVIPTPGQTGTDRA